MFAFLALDDEVSQHSSSSKPSRDVDIDEGDEQSSLSGKASVVSRSSSAQRLVAMMNSALYLDEEVGQAENEDDDDSCGMQSDSGSQWRQKKSRSVIHDNTLRFKKDSVSTDITLTSMTFGSIRETSSFIASHWQILALGQFISLVMSTGGAAQAMLQVECDLSAPLFCSGIFFVILSLHLIPIYERGVELRTRMNYEKEDSDEPLTQRLEGEVYNWFLCIFPIETDPSRYAGIAFLYVQACYCTILALKYTPMTSVTLFAALAVPSAMVFSKVFLSRSFGFVHLLGVIICMIGVFYNVWADYRAATFPAGLEEQDDYPNRLVGDLFAIIAGILYGFGNVMTETILKNDEGDITEYLGMIGFFASLISLLQGWLTERDDVMEMYTGGQCPSYKTGVFLLIYVISGALEYICTAYFLGESDATLLNISILTDSTGWSVLFTVVAQQIIPPPLYWTAIVLVVGGLLMYSMAPSPIPKEGDNRAISSMMSDDFDNQSDHVYSPHIALL
jgi:drug/metabolite transporter (DMT)-like permease